MEGLIRVRVVNNDKGRHDAFYAAKEELGGDRNLEFVEGNVKGSAEFGRMDIVSKQTEDLAYMLLGVNAKTADHIFVVEDDQLLCPNAMLAVQYLIRKAYSYAPDWLALRASVGFNGIVMRAADAKPLSDFLRLRLGRRPPDHLFSEWIQRPVGGSGDDVFVVWSCRSLTLLFGFECIHWPACG